MILSQVPVLRRIKKVEEHYQKAKDGVPLDSSLDFHNSKQFAVYCKIGKDLPLTTEVSLKIPFMHISTV